MSDTHPRYTVAQGERLRFGEFILEYQVIDTSGPGNGRVIHLGFVEDDASWIAEALNDHPQVERLTADLRKSDLDRELVRIERARLSDALREIVQHDSGGRGCSVSTNLRSACRQPNSGRTRGAKYGSVAWCASCIAADALGMEIHTLTVSVTGDSESVAAAIEWALSDMPDERRHYDDACTVEARDDEIVVWWSEEAR